METLPLALGVVMVNPLVNVSDWPSVLVTTTFHNPAVFPVIAKEQVIFIAETTDTLVAVMLVSPDFVRRTIGVVPTTKCVPARFVILTELLL